MKQCLETKEQFFKQEDLSVVEAQWRLLITFENFISKKPLSCRRLIDEFTLEIIYVEIIHWKHYHQTVEFTDDLQ